MGNVPDSTPNVSPRERRLHRLVVGAWITAGSFAIVAALGGAATWLTASPTVCGACHEMAPKVETWRASAHTQVGCPSCHEDARPWYLFPQTLARRGVMLGRDVRSHFSQRGPIDLTSAVATVTVPDSRCQRCHDPGRKVTIRFGTLIDHAEHAERNGSCISCHLWTGHPEPDADRPLLMMRQCFSCHGVTPTAKAPGACKACHPASFELVPASHAPDWKAAHGDPAKADRGQCLMCHREQMCRDCHGVEIPHPQGWAEGKGDHGAVATASRHVCSNCHKQGLDFCSMCHHEGYEPKRGPWVAQHPDAAEERGTAFCFDCHVATYCVRCHTSGIDVDRPEDD